MKHGQVNNSESEFSFWILPDKPMESHQYQIGNSTVGAWDRSETDNQTNAIKQYLEAALEPGSWTETNHRFFFKNQEDYENMLLMFSIGWNGQ